MCLLTSRNNTYSNEDDAFFKKIDDLGMTIRNHKVNDVKKEFEIALSSPRGTIRILSPDDIEYNKCLLQLLKDSDQLPAFTEKLRSIISVPPDGMNIYSDDDNSVCIKICISSLKQLKSFFAKLCMGNTKFVLKNEINELQESGNIELHLPEGSEIYEFKIHEGLELYEKAVLKLNTLTSEQDKLRQYCKDEPQVHIKGVAGTGKTFIALHLLLNHFTKRDYTNVLFVCRNLALAFHFLRWVLIRLDTIKSKQDSLLKRMFFLTTSNFFSIVIKKGKMEIKSRMKRIKTLITS